jgi:transglutaminase-like putative cysteine protease
MFVVQSPLPSYWRLTALSDFDGQQWRSDGLYRKSKSKLTETVPVKRQGTTINQFFTISSLSSIYLPAAYRPEKLGDVQLVSPDIDQLLLDPSGNSIAAPAAVPVRYNSDNASILTKNPTSDNLNYRVESSIPLVDAAGIAKASSKVPREISDTNLALPADFPLEVRDLARQIVKGQTTPYGKALALQDYLRKNYKYSLSVPAGHSDAAIVRFLFVDKAGYCEQFAGSYAAMARSIGLPARVAVGFTPGEFKNGSFIVTGRQAHAWPEVYINGYGWVPFEPTPGRGLPNDAAQYTHVAEQQDVASPGQTPTAVLTPATPATTPTTAVPQQQQQQNVKSDQAKGDEGNGSGVSLTWARRLVVVLLSIVAVFMLWATALQLLFALSRRRRHRAATTPTDRTLLAWDETIDELRSAGVEPKQSETAAEYARRAEATTRVDSNLLAGLATNVTTATFSPIGVKVDVAEQSEVAAATIASIMSSRRSTREKVWRVLDPRPLARR